MEEIGIVVPEVPQQTVEVSGGFVFLVFGWFQLIVRATKQAFSWFLFAHTLSFPFAFQLREVAHTSAIPSSPRLTSL